MRFKRELTEQEKSIFQKASTLSFLNIQGCGHNKSYYGLLHNISKGYDFKNKCICYQPLDINSIDSVTLANEYNTINTILKDVFDGFFEFYNFTGEKENRLRFGCNYDVGFNGVGYITLTELIAGSLNNQKGNK